MLPDHCRPNKTIELVPTSLPRDYYSFGSKAFRSLESEVEAGVVVRGMHLLPMRNM